MPGDEEGAYLVGKPATPLGRAMAAALRDAAAAKGLDHFDVADMFGVQPHYVRRLFKGEVTATIAKLEQYAHALGLEFNIFLTRINSRPTANHTRRRSGG